MWPSVPGGIFGNPLDFRAAHRDGVLEARFAQTGGFDFAAQIDGAGGIEAGADADAVLAGRERDLVRADGLAFGRKFHRGWVARANRW
jgi:hypothetical protein